MKKKLFGIILSIDNYKIFYQQNKELLDQLSINFNEVYIINVNQLKFRSKKKKLKIKRFYQKILFAKIFINLLNFLNFLMIKNL